MIILALMLPALIFLFSFKAYVFDADFYRSEFAKHGVYDAMPDADAALSNLLDYFRTGAELDKVFYTEREMLHLKDVRALIWAGIYALDIIFILSLILIIVMLAMKDFHALGTMMIASGAMAFVIAMLVATLSMFSFPSMFLMFHEAAFSNSLWLLPSGTSLIKMFPQQFFYGMARAMLINSMYLSMFFAAIGFGARQAGER